ncbi:Kinesin-like protein klpA [Diplonema papillatum]|nr:Kinesin-like protein klpA [Diplonema papillatum]
MSTRVLLQWLNDKLETKMAKINEMADGWQYCQLLDMAFAKAVPLSRVCFKPRNEDQKLANFKLVLTFLEKQHAEFPSGSIDVQKLVKGGQTHNLNFLSWFKQWIDQSGEPFDPSYQASLRRDTAKSSSKTPAKPPGTVTPRAERAVRPAASRKRPREESPHEIVVTRALDMDAEPTPQSGGGGKTPTPAVVATSEDVGPAMAFLMNKTNKRKRQRTDAAMPPPSATSLQQQQQQQQQLQQPGDNLAVHGTTHNDSAPPRPSVAGGAAHKQEVKKLQEEIKRKHAEHAKAQKELKDANQQLLDDNKALEDRNKALERGLSAAREELKEMKGESKGWKDKVAVLQRDMESATSQLREKDNHITRADSVRKMLHNSLQELKGNIRVFARLRPCLGSEQGSDKLFGFPDDLDSRKIEICEPPTTSVTGAIKPGKVTSFEFDRAFAPTSPQSDVFEEVAQLVHSVMDGYKVCIFAYGQTGSGKTYTMEGTRGEEHKGLIPRAVQLLFERSKGMADAGWDMQLKARFVEIYNDKLRDLLGETPDGAEHKKIDIHHSKDEQDTNLSNCSLLDVSDESSVHSILETARSRRTVSATKMNESSSRSHSVFTLKITGKNAGTGQFMASEINLIDLAGSERIKDSGVTGDALKEAEHINTSLTHLGNVIQQLHTSKGDRKKMNHIFRNSTLTWLLKSCLGGDCKTLMLVNISPVPSSLSETTNSLRFATKVNNCQIGTASKRVK